MQNFKNGQYVEARLRNSFKKVRYVEFCEENNYHSVWFEGDYVFVKDESIRNIKVETENYRKK